MDWRLKRSSLLIFKSLRFSNEVSGMKLSSEDDDLYSFNVNENLSDS